MALKYSNNATTTLAAAITSTTATSLTVATGSGALFPTLSGSDYFLVTLTFGSAMEIVKVTGVSGDVFTIVRGQESTTPNTFPAGAAVGNYLTKGALDQIKLDALPSSSDAVPEGSSNLYFTAARVLATVLSGLSTATASAVAATDTILVAIGKLQAQINTKISGNQTITVSGDASGSGTTSINLTLASSGVTAGTYNSVTVDAKGRVTAASNVSVATGHVPFYTSAGAANNINLTTDNKIPFYKSTGTASNIPLTV
jgi:hypothetical protein